MPRPSATTPHGIAQVATRKGVVSRPSTSANVSPASSSAALAALDDAGLTLADVDGLLTTPLRVATWAMPCGVVAEGLGIKPRYLATLDVAGASGASMVHHA